MIRARDYLDAVADLPLRPLRNLLGSGPLLVLAPHPDDESIGCGGMIATACAEGIPVHVAVLTDGTKSHPDSPSYPPERLRDLREREARAAVKALGLDTGAITFLRQPDTKVPQDGSAFDAVCDRIAQLLADHRATTLCTTWRYDPHCDHESAARLAAAVCVRTGARHVAFPVWGWTLPDDTPLDLSPPRGGRLDISARLAVKRRAIAAHVSQTTRLIDDSPFGFQLPDTFLDLFARPWEAFIEP